MRISAVHFSPRYHETSAGANDPGPGYQDSLSGRLEVVDLHLGRRAALTQCLIDPIPQRGVSKREGDAPVDDPRAVQVLVPYLKPHGGAVLVKRDELDANRLVEPIGLEGQEPVSRIGRIAIAYVRIRPIHDAEAMAERCIRPNSISINSADAIAVRRAVALGTPAAPKGRAAVSAAKGKDVGEYAIRSGHAVRKLPVNRVGEIGVVAPAEPGR